MNYVALGFLHRDGTGTSGRCRNTEATAHFLDKNQPEYMGGVLEMANDRVFRFWSDLKPALKTGKPQNEVTHNQKPVFETIYADPARMEQFVGAMSGPRGVIFKPLLLN